MYIQLHNTYIIIILFQVPLGVILKNENVIEDMIGIVSEMHKYVPTKYKETIDENTQKVVSSDVLHSILFGRDQLTRKRSETAIELRKNGTSPAMQLKGLIPMCEDWHTKRVLLEVFCCDYIIMHIWYMCV